MSDPAIIETLPVEQRLALAYASAPIRKALLASLGLDVRLAKIVANAREPVLGQIRLAWWRERLADPAPVPGEPLLQTIFSAPVDRQALRNLVDGWETVLLATDSADQAAVSSLAQARAECFAALAGNVRHDAVLSAARSWALADLARLPGPPGMAALAMARDADWSRPGLPRSMRPLAVLHAMARRAVRSKGGGEGPVSFLVAVRVGLLGF
ncbi:hypothetical protein [Novosphingobium sp.]|uniref:hypothetical protein n=1 Tax=Novosphingobium sp. TaxID=1874826 RepID=UPI0025EFFCA4|nr:hypothetical protein [Novosphingobium sp.]